MLFNLFDQHIGRMLVAVFERLDPEAGLHRHPVGPDLWQFYEWEDGMAGVLGGDAEDTRRLRAPDSFFLHEAIGSYAWMLCGGGPPNGRQS